MNVAGPLILILLTFSMFTSTKSQVCVIDHRSRQNNYEQEVLKHITCKYGYIMQHFKDPKILVKINFITDYYIVDDERKILNLNVYKLQRWEDPKIEWNPDDYGAVDNIISHFVGIPTVSPINMLNKDFWQLDRDECLVRKSGKFSCLTMVLFEIPCITKLTSWPYDSRICILEFSKRINGNKVNLHFEVVSFLRSKAQEGNAWSMSHIKQEENVTTDVYLRMTFTLDRQAPGLVAVIVYPSLILSILTLSCLILEVKSNIRFSLLYFSLCSHFFMLSEISACIPRLGETIPTILLYYRGSLVLTSLSLLLTCILRYLCTKVLAPPTWMHSCNEYVYKSVARFIVWPRWYTDDSSVVEWTKFSYIINSVCNIVFVIIYVSMYVAYVP